MTDHRIGVIINGATGRMGTTQHIANLLAIAADGGLALRTGERLIPELLLAGRDAARLKTLSAAHDGQRWTTRLDEAFAGTDSIFVTTPSAKVEGFSGKACSSLLPYLLKAPSGPQSCFQPGQVLPGNVLSRTANPSSGAVSLTRFSLWHKRLAARCARSAVALSPEGDSPSRRFRWSTGAT